jgi:cytochrome c2
MFDLWGLDVVFKAFYQWWDKEELEKLNRSPEEILQELRMKAAGGWISKTTSMRVFEN